MRAPLFYYLKSSDPDARIGLVALTPVLSCEIEIGQSEKPVGS